MQQANHNFVFARTVTESTANDSAFLTLAGVVPCAGTEQRPSNGVNIVITVAYRRAYWLHTWRMVRLKEAQKKTSASGMHFCHRLIGGAGSSRWLTSSAGTCTWSNLMTHSSVH